MAGLLLAATARSAKLPFDGWPLSDPNTLAAASSRSAASAELADPAGADAGVAQSRPAGAGVESDPGDGADRADHRGQAARGGGVRCGIRSAGQAGRRVARLHVAKRRLLAPL